MYLCFRRLYQHNAAMCVTSIATSLKCGTRQELDGLRQMSQPAAVTSSAIGPWYYFELAEDFLKGILIGGDRVAILANEVIYLYARAQQLDGNTGFLLDSLVQYTRPVSGGAWNFNNLGTIGAKIANDHSAGTVQTHRGPAPCRAHQS